MFTTIPLHCVFYSHEWSIFQLESLGLIKTAKEEMILELAQESNFATVFGRPEKRKGLIRLLRPGINLHMLAFRPEALGVPMVLAPVPAVPVESLVSAVALIPTLFSPIEKVTVLVHVNDGPAFADAFPLMSDFSIVWDTADYPTNALTELTQSLASANCLSKDKWKGFYLCNHPNRQFPDYKERESLLRKLLGDFPVLSPA